MNHKAILIALGISAIVTTIVLSVLGGYSSTTTPEGVVSHHYTMDYLGIYLVVFGIFIAPITYIVGYPASLLLFRLGFFNFYCVAIVGIVGAVSAVSVFFGTLLFDSVVVAYYGFGGLVAATTAYVGYKNLTSSSKATPNSGAL